MEQFASFMGHTKKTHENYYRLPQDIYQTAKVSKLLLAINSGKAQAYKGKSLDEIELSDGIETDSDLELTKDQHRGGEPTEKWNDCCDESKEESIIENTMEQIAGLQSQKEGKNYSETKKSTQDKKITRTRWLEEDKKIVRGYVQDHIKNKKAPKKHEVETFLDHHKSFLKKTNWVKLKPFVCNCYK
ncbi:uncharacterized protein LOC126749100 isoform X2 [Anthonomus grandis grandis]|uniref:uncharacterized protein LOC126749100 isoform X2 n=1 Tax=Anthonomus grandis grandis TaxID=2921223 RepID=UPI00216579BD|nr:uncharacterized protein LOC126749100 isoform X2 [Anthonomus grandis grandis]